MCIVKMVKLLLLDYLCYSYIFADENDPRTVVVKQLALIVADRPDMTLDLTGDLSKLKKQVTYLYHTGVSYSIHTHTYVYTYLVSTCKIRIPLGKVITVVSRTFYSSGTLDRCPKRFSHSQSRRRRDNYIILYIHSSMCNKLISYF